MRKARTIRMQQNLTIEAVVRGTSISAGHLSLFERGAANLSSEKLHELAKFYQCSMDELYEEA